MTKPSRHWESWGRVPIHAVAMVVLAMLLSTQAYAQNTTASQAPFIVVVNNAPPFRIVEEWGGKSGYSGAYIDTINEISERANLPLTFVHTPFARALRMMETGQADMMLGPNWSIDRAEYMVYLKAAFPAESKVFFLSKSADDIDRYSDLKGHTIGVLRGARYFSPFDEDDTLDKYPVNNYENAFKMLEHDRLYALIIPERQGRFLQRSLGYDFRESSFQVPGRPSFITISRNSRLIHHKAKIEKVMSDLNAEGFFERLMLLYLE